MMAEKVFIDFKNVAAFTCQECGKSWKKDLTPIMDRINKTAHLTKFKYPCGHSFSVIFNKRRHN
jgi:protein-arginine kinase activator protein McsA